MASVTDRIDALFAEWDKPDSPGAALGIIHDGDLVYTRGYGMADLEHGVPIAPKSVFYIASVSKQFTAASIVLLALRGRISLDDDIRTYVPEIPRYEHSITVRHLIHHTSGLRDYLDLMALAGSDFTECFDIQDAVEILSRQEGVNFAPGEQYLYCNSGYVLLAEIVKRVTGTSLREFAETSIFRPLGMHHTLFDDDITRGVANRVISYRPGDNGDLQAWPKNFNAVGSGGLLTTVEDLYLWDQGIYEGTLGGQAFVDRMLTPGTLNNGEELTYACGLVLGEYKGLKTVGHSGGMLGFRTEMMRFPEQRFTVICLCNLSTMTPRKLAERIADLYLVDEFGLEAFAGEYWSDELRFTYTLVVEDGNLFLRHPNAPEAPLESVRCDTFRIQDREIVFVRGEERRVTGFSVSTERSKGVRFVRTP